ncbi:hybrid sensor histidine kinase/response regulator [Pedobacter sp. SYSU D00535]|uniref:hybrid sensor histidine kinase/response regulator n=1 Tax=Pedobacter sp. SYSU D00535 TaxID=2810308 RepID=UPI001A9732DA|nr:hybrid sensor histidine kinase/response regulator [Pedobacter sp. SYSU D00535]
MGNLRDKRVVSDTIKILLVDDREDNLMSMEIVLEKQGYSFAKATSGIEALKILLKEDDFSLILLDVKMPIMDGYETAELIYQREKLKNIPIIFITGQDYEETAVFKGYQAGAVDYIRKPFNPQILRSKVAVFAELYKKNQLLKKQEDKLKAINEDLVKLNQDLENRVRERTLELENLNHELRGLNIAKDKILSVISHDLRNPFTALLASSEKLNRDFERLEPREIKNFSNIIYRTSNRILGQLNDLVEWAKQQNEKSRFSPTKIHLVEGLKESLELLKSNAIQKGIRLENNVPSNIFVKADALMLRSILQNIVTNAIKFTPEGGSVRLKADEVEAMAEICVEDTGVGMSEEMKSKLLLEPGSHSVSGTNNEQGSGLGLILVRDFVAQHGGVIKVESEIGKGTCFKFTIPLYN